MFALQYDQLDRHGEWRKNDAKMKQLIEQDHCYFLPVHKQLLSLQQEHLYWLTKDQLLNITDQISHTHLIYLGQSGQKHYFAYRMSEAESFDNTAPSQSDLRNLLYLLNPEQAYLANSAVALNHWHASHQYCGYCGHDTYAKEYGYVRLCTNNHCQKEHFPRTDPAIIVAINQQISGQPNKLLLGRQANWPEKRYSVIAGFVEPGESLEQAVAREAREEVGVKLDTIEYFGSQPWPFPQSVMLGFTANCKQEVINLKDQELEDAGWFSRQQIEDLVAKQQLKLPYKASISRALVEDWLAKH